MGCWCNIFNDSAQPATLACSIARFDFSLSLLLCVCPQPHCWILLPLLLSTSKQHLLLHVHHSLFWQIPGGRFVWHRYGRREVGREGVESINIYHRVQRQNVQTDTNRNISSDRVQIRSDVWSSGGVVVSALASQQERFAKTMNVRRIGKSKLSLSVSVTSCLFFDVAVP